MKGFEWKRSGEKTTTTHRWNFINPSRWSYSLRRERISPPHFPPPSLSFFLFLALSRSILARSTRPVFSPCLRVSFLLLAFVLYTFSLPPRRTEVVYSRVVCPEVVLPCTWIPIYAQIPDLSWPKKYLDAGVSRILLLRGTPRYRGYIFRRKKNARVSFLFSVYTILWECDDYI